MEKLVLVAALLINLIDIASADVAFINVCPGNGKQSASPYSCHIGNIELYTRPFDPETLDTLPSAPKTVVIDCDEHRKKLQVESKVDVFVIINRTIHDYPQHSFQVCSKGTKL